MGHRLGTLQQLLRHWVVDAVVAVLEVLLREGIVGIAGFLVSVRTFFPPFAFSFHPEGADVRSVSLVVGGCASQFLQQLRLVAEKKRVSKMAQIRILFRRSKGFDFVPWQLAQSASWANRRRLSQRVVNILEAMCEVKFSKKIMHT